MKYASASPKVGSILLRCDVGGWEDVSSFAALLFELCTISILLYGVEEAYPRILSKPLPLFGLTTICDVSDVTSRPLLRFLLSLLLPLVHDPFSVSLRWGCYPSFLSRQVMTLYSVVVDSL